MATAQEEKFSAQTLRGEHGPNGSYLIHARGVEGTTLQDLLDFLKEKNISPKVVHMDRNNMLQVNLY